MLARPILVVLAAGAVASPLASQETARRAAPGAFPFTVAPYLGLGFRGTRANQTDPTDCPSTPCISHKVTSGPSLGVELQAPLTRNIGVSLSGAASLPDRVGCLRGSCATGEGLTAIRGTALLVFRLKARAPMFFGFGGALMRFDPGPVTGQAATLTEYGGVVVVGYDFSLGRRIGTRVRWLNYFMSPNTTGLGSPFTASSIAYDAVIGIGARIGL